CHIATMAKQLQEADEEVTQAMAEIQPASGTKPPEAPQRPAQVSIREVVEGQVDIKDVFSMGDFLGISDVVASHELDEQDIKELGRRKAEAPDNIQTHLSNIFKGALEQVAMAKEAHKEHVKRLEGKKRKVEGGASTAGLSPWKSQRPAHTVTYESDSRIDDVDCCARIDGAFDYDGIADDDCSQSIIAVHMASIPNRVDW
ncbi:unnamed protein product, partial [Prorocentrum cordatum]